MNIPFRRLDEVLVKVIRDAGLTHQVDDQDFKEWALFAMQDIGAYHQFAQKTARLEVQDYIGLLPEDFYRVNEDLVTRSFKVQGTSIITSKKSGVFALPYLAFASEEDEQTGEVQLLVPDISTYQSAIQWYIYSRLCLQGKFPNQTIDYTYANQKWLNLCAAARDEINLAAVASNENIKKTINDRNNPRFGTATHGYPWIRRS